MSNIGLNNNTNLSRRNSRLAETRLRIVHTLAFRVTCKRIALFLRHGVIGIALVRRRVFARISALFTRLT